MCGIVGIYLKNKKYNKQLGKLLTGMMNNMASRGPDSAGFAVYNKSNNFKYTICLHGSLNSKDLQKNLKTKINIQRPNLSKVKTEVKKCVKMCLTKKMKHNKKSSKNKTRRRKK